MPAKVNPDKCSGCASCEDACPIECIKVDEVAKVDENECTECGTCVDECPEGAITLPD